MYGPRPGQRQSHNRKEAVHSDFGGYSSLDAVRAWFCVRFIEIT
jgi:hypothetical protein